MIIKTAANQFSVNRNILLIVSAVFHIFILCKTILGHTLYSKKDIGTVPKIQKKYWKKCKSAKYGTFNLIIIQNYFYITDVVEQKKNVPRKEKQYWEILTNKLKFVLQCIT